MSPTSASDLGNLPLPTATFMDVDAGDDVRRYEDLGLIGHGAMGEVRRVRDIALNRVMAMKMIRPELMGMPPILARFVEEAQATAQLAHPGVVSVHELGRLQDGRLYFTMKLVQGRTLSEIIAEVHEASPNDAWQPSPSGWTFRRLIHALGEACDAVASAHNKGLVHRDLKPENLMVGSYGEVLVMDWGLAKVVSAADPLSAMEGIETVRSTDGSMATKMGTVAGTPAYMAPEQARGEIDRIVPATDVYALGAFLYEILSGRPPYRGSDGHAVLRMVLAGPPEPPGRSGQAPAATTTFFFGIPDLAPTTEAEGPPIPQELIDICNKAMSREVGDRYQNAAAMAREVQGWLNGVRKRDQALEAVALADAIVPEVRDLLSRADTLERRAAAVLDGIPGWMDVDQKRDRWAELDEATRLRREARVRQVEHIQYLRAALTQVPGLPEAHDRLADHYRTAHERAEAARNHDLAAEYEVLLRGHDTGRHSAYLDGAGTLTILTVPPCEAELFEYVARDRRLVAEPRGSLGKTPILAKRMSMGSYLVVLRGPGDTVVHYPVFIDRERHWDGVAPGARTPMAIPIPAGLPSADAYVPAGWFQFGGDPHAANSAPRRRVWVDGFVIKRFQVTNTEYIEFLDDLVAKGREEEALRYAPRERAATHGELGTMVYGRDPDGRFVLRPDVDGDMWEPDYPVFLVDWVGATAYADWLAERDGLPWRLVGEVEWEKAARGVDGRFYPWGDHHDPTWCCMRDSHRDRPLPAVVGDFPVDESPYGVRGMAGNIRDWCMETHDAGGVPFDGDRVKHRRPADDVLTENTFQVIRGGHWFASPSECRSADRAADRAMQRDTILGIRVMRYL